MTEIAKRQMPGALALVFWAMVFLAIAACAKAPEPQITLADGWVRVPPGGRDVTGGYLLITNTGGADKLLTASAREASSVELHTHDEKDGMMQMRELQYLDIPKGASIQFAPGGLHLMVFGVEGLQKGDTVHFTLLFEKSGPLTFMAKVGKPEGATGHTMGH